MNVIVENPVGPLALGVSPDNPYKDCPSSVESEEGHRWVYFGETAIQLDEEDIQRALELEKHAGFVKILAIVDMFTGIINATIIGYMASTITVFLSFLGYSGAARYNRGMVIFYLAYQYLMTLARGLVFIYVCQNDPGDTQMMIISPFSLLIQIFITRYVWKFYAALPRFVY